MFCGLKNIFFSPVQVFCVAVEVFHKHIFILFFFSSFVVSHLVAFSIETMDGMLWWLLFFGLFNAKFIKIAM